jgi:hypothetical protein
LAKPNYQFEKRQRDLEKKRKQEEKRQRKLAATTPPNSGEPPVTPVPGAAREPGDPAELPKT